VTVYSLQIEREKKKPRRRVHTEIAEEEHRVHREERNVSGVRQEEPTVHPANDAG